VTAVPSNRSRRAFAARLVPVVAALGAVLIAGCSSGQGQGTTDPSTSAQANARLLQFGKTPGFVPGRGMHAQSGPAKAKPFVPPRGSTDHVCNDLTSPELFRPGGSVDVGESITLPIRQQPRYLPIPPWWFEWMDVYPGTEAAGIVKALPQLIGRCTHFVFRGGGATLRAHEAVAPLRGLGDQALYVSVRFLSTAPGRFSADDWVVIRSDRTLIWIGGQSVRPPANGRDRLTLQLTRDAWHRYSA
jgi:hypothetical protein